MMPRRPGKLGDDIVEVEIGILRLRIRPHREGAHDVVAEQHHQMIAFGKNH